MSTYLSHPVRRMRDDPIADETVRLVVELADAEGETPTSTVEALSGTVERELRFDSYLIEVPQSAVAELCELPGLARIETANTLSLTGIDDDATAAVDDGEAMDRDFEE